MHSWCVKEYDMRAQLTSGGVVHAAYKHTIGPYTTYSWGNREGTKVPQQEGVFLACRRRMLRIEDSLSEKDILPKNTAVTCKNCLKVMGITAEEPTPTRYIVIDTKTGMYFKKTRNFCSDPWVDDVLDATIYKSQSAAVHQTKRVFYYDADGNEMPYKEYNKMGFKERQERGWYTKYLPHPRYEVKEVKITIE